MLELKKTKYSLGNFLSFFTNIGFLKDKVLKLLKIYNFNLIGEIDKGGHDYYLSNYNI